MNQQFLFHVNLAYSLLYNDYNFLRNGACLLGFSSGYAGICYLIKTHR